MFECEMVDERRVYGSIGVEDTWNAAGVLRSRGLKSVATYHTVPGVATPFVEVFRQLRQREYTGGVIIITGSHDEERLDEAWAVGPQEVIGKPIDLEQLLMSIQLVLVCREC